MTMLALIALSMALAIDAHEARGATPATPAAQAPPRPETRAMGGPYEPVEPGPAEAILVEGERSGPGWTVAPDPALARRYAPRPRRPVGTITIRF